MTYALICEGACNPTLPSVDAMVRAAVHPRDSYDQATRRVLDTSEGNLGDWLRAQKHTPHVKVNHRAHNRYACQVCGSDRRFGGG